jgi:hypothetical protein
VAQVEAGPQGAFLDTGEPVLLYERHVFHRATSGRFDGELVTGLPTEQAILSSPVPGGYGPSSIQHRKLQAAVVLNRDAALRSCSWGLFQIMGVNHVQAGFPRLQDFVSAMYRSADDHLRAFVMFIRHDWRLVDALRERDWVGFAGTYNGPQFMKNQYDSRMASAYATWSAAANA